MSFQTTKPAIARDPNTGQEYALTFDAKGTTSSSDATSGSITSGTFQISSNGNVLTSGHISRGQFSNNSNGASISMVSTVIVGQDTYHYDISTDCSTFEDNKIDVLVIDGPHTEYSGPVECSPAEGGGADRDSDGDGIPDSSDKCANNSNPRCYKEAA
jgi:hypothetical protein